MITAAHGQEVKVVGMRTTRAGTMLVLVEYSNGTRQIRTPGELRCSQGRTELGWAVMPFVGNDFLRRVREEMGTLRSDIDTVTDAMELRGKP